MKSEYLLTGKPALAAMAVGPVRKPIAACLIKRGFVKETYDEKYDLRDMFSVYVIIMEKVGNSN